MRLNHTRLRFRIDLKQLTHIRVRRARIKQIHAIDPGFDVGHLGIDSIQNSVLYRYEYL